LFDVELVERLGVDPRRVAADLTKRISDEQRRRWSGGAAARWATGEEVRAPNPRPNFLSGP
jgi:hypothetical protein